ncbi:hypothetical protein Syun_008146 [Stephania yunnanensis]|uniref:Uncharacterized protein n=1 Tax=Stephania yunnanensis TaxID=152371 RepID=A0AAP0L2C8_9MAGN
MEGETKKRRVCDDEVEDEKVEKFFGLIKGFRDARERLRLEVIEEANMVQSRKKNKMKGIQGGRAAWVPSFKWEDFTEKIEFGDSSKGNGTKSTTKKNGGEGDGGLDLKLSLN